MILLCVTLLLLHQGYTLIPVITVQLGEPVTFTCVSPDEDYGIKEIYWYKQNVGDTLKLIVKLLKNVKPKYAPGFVASRLELNNYKNISNLTILRTIQEDEGMYHCEVTDWLQNTWSGTYLSLKGNTERTSNYTVVQWPTVSDPVHSGDSVTLQCSVLSDSENKTCPGGHSVYWFRARSDGSHPDIIYTDGNRPDECDKRPDSLKTCVHRFSKNVSPSDAGTYHCAVATCGVILFGNGTKLQIEQTTSYEFTGLVIAIVCLAISLIGNIVFICYRTPRAVCAQFKGIESASSQARNDNLRQPVHEITEGGDDLNYAGLHFSKTKTTRGWKKKELTDESVYAQVKR